MHLKEIKPRQFKQEMRYEKVKNTNYETKP